MFCEVHFLKWYNVSEIYSMLGWIYYMILCPFLKKILKFLCFFILLSCPRVMFSIRDDQTEKKQHNYYYLHALHMSPLQCLSAHREMKRNKTHL